MSLPAGSIQVALGYSADIPTLRQDYPEVGWRTFEEWAKSQDWSVLEGPAE